MDLDHIQVVTGFPLPEGTRSAAEAGVVDEEVESRVIGDAARDTLDAFGSRQVGLENFGRDAVLFPELAGQIFEPVQAPGDEDEVRSCRGQLAGVFRSHAGRGAGDQGGPIGDLGHGFLRPPVYGKRQRISIDIRPFSP